MGKDGKILNIGGSGKKGIFPERLEITSMPKKTEYFVGDIFAPDGMIVSIVYTNGTRAPIEKYVINPSGPLAEKDDHITISYTEAGKTVSVDINIKVSHVHVFGVVWTYNNPNTKLTRLTKDTDPYGLVTEDALSEEPQPYTNSQDGSSPFDNYMPWAGMEEYNIIINTLGTVKIKFGDAGFSRTDNDTTVYIPKFWYAVKDDADNSKRYFYIGDGPTDGLEVHPGSDCYVAKYLTTGDYGCKSGKEMLDGGSDTGGLKLVPSAFETNAKNKGSGWQSYDYAAWCAIGLLYLVEYADWDSQTVLNYTNYYSQWNKTTGVSDTQPYHTGYALYRHIEHLIGFSQYVSGIKISASQGTYHTTFTIRIGTSPYEELSYSKRESVATGLLMSNSTPWALLPYLDTNRTGSDTTYITDESSLGYTNVTSGTYFMNVGGNPNYSSSSNRGYNGLFYIGLIFDRYNGYVWTPRLLYRDPESVE